MTTTPAGLDEPLILDVDVARRVEHVIGRALERRVWLLLLDASAVQLPVLLPCDGVPARPAADDADHLGRVVREIAVIAGAASVVIVLERPGPERIAEPDREWARTLRAACGNAGMPLRALLLSHTRGVRWIAPDDEAPAG